MITEKVKVVSGTFTKVTAETQEDMQYLESELTEGQQEFLKGLRMQVAKNMNKPFSDQLVKITGKYFNIVPCEIIKT